MRTMNLIDIKKDASPFDPKGTVYVLNNKHPKHHIFIRLDVNKADTVKAWAEFMRKEAPWAEGSFEPVQITSEVFLFPRGRATVPEDLGPHIRKVEPEELEKLNTLWLEYWEGQDDA